MWLTHEPVAYSLYKKIRLEQAGGINHHIQDRWVFGLGPSLNEEGCRIIPSNQHQFVWPESPRREVSKKATSLEFDWSFDPEPSSRSREWRILSGVQVAEELTVQQRVSAYGVYFTDHVHQAFIADRTQHRTLSYG
jgi:hypothetical protein